MKTIEERANKCAYDLRVIGHDCENVVKDAYRKGIKEQNTLIHQRLTEMQGEYITLELINELVKRICDEIPTE